MDMKKTLVLGGFLAASLISAGAFSTVNAGGLGILTSALGKSVPDKESVYTVGASAPLPVKVYFNTHFIGAIDGLPAAIQFSFAQLKENCNSSICSMTITSWEGSEGKEEPLVSTQFYTASGILDQEVRFVKDGYSFISSQPHTYTIQLDDK